MTSVAPPISAGGSLVAQASELALRLAQADTALRALTSGQVDAIVDADGQSYLLRPAQEHLRKNEQRLLAVIESAADVITVLNRGGVIVSQNSAVKRVLGYEPGALIGRPFFDLVHEGDLALVYLAFFNVVEGFDEQTTVHFSHRDPRGLSRMVEATISQLRGSSAASVVVSMRSLSLTARASAVLDPPTTPPRAAPAKAANETTQPAARTIGQEPSAEGIETYAQDIVDTVREPLLMLDISLRVRSANRAFYETFKVSPGETENHLIYELGNGQWDIPALRELLQDIIGTSSVFNDYELEHTFPIIGRRVMLLNARKLRAGSHAELLVLAMEDVTQRRRAEEEVAKATKASENANKTKSLFLANMSHELRTPLNAILGYSEMLREQAAERDLDEFAVDLEKIRAAGKHLLALINDILDLSKIEAGKMELFLEDFDVDGMIEEVASTIQPLIEKHANTLHIERASNLGVMHADQIKVRQALYNLLSNAAKFTHDGKITLEAGRELMDGGEWIVFRLIDTGIGLSSEQIVKLFQAFTQADPSTTRKFGGTGLGLALTRRFCQIMGGDVTVHSTLHQGSVFTIKLPAVVQAMSIEADVVEPAPATGSVSAENGAGESLPAANCVLVIDDDPIQRNLIQRFLTREGFTVRCADGGEEGLRLARQLHPIAITLDVMMPSMDGWSVLAALKSEMLLRDIPVIMLTMVDDPGRGFTLGAAEFATKPVDQARLSQILRKYASPEPPCTVLLVEDDPAARATTRQILEKEGWEVTEAENGQIALECMEKAEPHLVMLDLMMPEMDGFEFVDRMRHRPEWCLIPIVVVTARDLSAEDRHRLNGYVEAIIKKSGDSQELLLSKVRDLVNRARRSLWPAPREAAPDTPALS